MGVATGCGCKDSVLHLGGGEGGPLPPLGELLPPLDFCKVNTLYTPLPPVHFENSEFAPPNHIFCMQH